LKQSHRLSKRIVDGARPGCLLWDSDLKGFGLRVLASGARHYVLKYRVGGRQRWITIGRHGSPWTPEQARKRALHLAGLVAQGEDPADGRDAAKAALTVRGLVERFDRERIAKRKASTAREYRREIEHDILPALGALPVAKVTRADVARFHDARRDHPYQANRLLALTSTLFNFAEKYELRPAGSNPCRHVERFHEDDRERLLSEAELIRLGDALGELERENKISVWAAAALRLLILTGARKGEILGLRWSEVDLEQGALRLADSKTGRKSVWLNAPALQILAGLPRVEGNEFAIVGHRTGQPLVDINKPWREIRRRADLGDLRIHDLRHSFASLGAGAGLSLLMIGKLLGHKVPETTQRYAHLAADPQRRAVELIGSRIPAAVWTGKRSTESAT
jgi:integrase